MSLTITCYEDWGPATGSPAKGTTRTQVTNCNLKTYSDPAQNYYLNDVKRPLGGLASQCKTCSFTRYFSWQISGSFSRLKNVRIVIPSGFEQDNWRVMYGLKSTYVAPASSTDDFGNTCGAFDGTLNTLTGPITLYPLLSTTGPEAATSRSIVNSSSSTTIYTQWLALQFMAHPSSFSDVDNFGTDTIQLLVDEMEI